MRRRFFDEKVICVVFGRSLGGMVGSLRRCHTQ
jgi:hypothetical protein